MSPSLMDPGDNSLDSLSAEESLSNAAGSEREGEVGHTGGKRRVKNRDAARRTRRKQTERADELHEELQSLEQSNSTLRKEIAALRKDFQRYTKILTHHEPHCHLGASASDVSGKNPSGSPAPSPGAAAETSAPAAPPSPFLTSGLDPLFFSSSSSSPVTLPPSFSEHLSPFGEASHAAMSGPLLATPCGLSTVASLPLPTHSLTPPPAGAFQMKQTYPPPPPYPYAAGEPGGLGGPLCPVPPADPLEASSALTSAETSFPAPLGEPLSDAPSLAELLDWLSNTT